MKIDDCKKCEYLVANKGIGCWCVENSCPIDEVVWCGKNMAEIDIPTERVETG